MRPAQPGRAVPPAPNRTPPAGPGIRHTFRTVADGAKDLPAADHIMGHEVAHMSSAYHEGIGDDRLKAVTDHVRTGSSRRPPQSRHSRRSSLPRAPGARLPRGPDPSPRLVRSCWAGPRGRPWPFRAGRSVTGPPSQRRPAGAGPPTMEYTSVSSEERPRPPTRPTSKAPANWAAEKVRRGPK